MHNNIFEIGAKNINVEDIVAHIGKEVERKTKDGVYTDSRVARAETSNLANLKNDDNFVPFYLECLREAVFIDISDFEIVEKRKSLSIFLLPLKKIIWNMLKFYTYRLWSQQNQVNGLLLSSVDSIHDVSQRKIAQLEERIKELEAKLGNETKQ